MIQAIRSVELANHVTISYFEKGSPTGIPLIMLPGLADSWRIFGRLVPYIPESIHIYALSQRGHGDSSRPDAGYRTKDFTTDLAMFMAVRNIDKAIIVGASSGGFTARNFAINHPELTLGLVLIGAPATLQGIAMVQETWKTTLSKLEDPLTKEFVEIFSQSILTESIPVTFVETVLQENLKVPARVWRDTTAGILEEQFPGQLGKVTVPTLIIWGSQDKLLTRSSQEAMAKVIPNAQLIVHENAGHLLYCDHPEEVARDITAFIEKTSQKSE